MKMKKNKNVTQINLLKNKKTLIDMDDNNYDLVYI